MSKFEKIILVSILIIVSGCAATPKVNYEIPASVYSQDVEDPLSEITEIEWSPLISNIASLSKRRKYSALISNSEKLSTKSTQLLTGDSTGRNRGIRVGIKGLIISYVVKDLSSETFHILPFNYSSAISENKDAYMKIGLTDEVFYKSLINLTQSLNLPELSAQYFNKKRLLSLTPKSNIPAKHSREALQIYLQSVMNGESLSVFWCEETKILRSELFSPRSFKILGVKGTDYYIQGSYYNSYDVMIESSNKGGSPIIHTWNMTMKYSELIYRTGSVNWCISSFSE